MFGTDIPKVNPSSNVRWLVRCLVWSSEERIGSHYYIDGLGSHRREYNKEKTSRIKPLNKQ